MADSTDVRALAEGFFVVRNGDDPAVATEGVMDRFASNARFQIIGTERLGGFTRKYEGAEALRPAVTAFVADWDLSNLVKVSTHTDGDTVFIHWKGKVRFIPTGQEFETEFMDKMTFRDGKIIDYRQFVDTLGFAETFGMVRLAEE